MTISEITTMVEYNNWTADGNVVVDFYADWCAPCKIIAPLLESLDEQHDNVTFYQVNVDTAQPVAAHYEILSMPNVICYKNGKEIARIIGADKGAITTAVNDLAATV